MLIIKKNPNRENKKGKIPEPMKIPDLLKNWTVTVGLFWL